MGTHLPADGLHQEAVPVNGVRNERQPQERQGERRCA
jgi:hypothetical protein